MDCAPKCPSYEMLNFWALPFFVFTTMTPEAPREPYWAVCAAFFRTVKEAISAGKIVESVDRSEEIPSMMTSGSLPPVMDVVPRTRTLLSMAMRSEPSVDTLTPATWPLRDFRGVSGNPLFILPSSTTAVRESLERVSVCCLSSMI